MQLGAPVICSDATSLPEVVGEAALLTGPEDDMGTAEKILRLQKDESLRQELIKKGTENVKRFGWDSRTKEYWRALFGEE